MAADIRKLLGFEIERPDPVRDLEKHLECLRDPECLMKMAKQWLEATRFLEFLENGLFKLFELPKVDREPPEGCTDLALDNCDTRMVHASQLSEVEVELLTGRAEIAVDGNDPVEFEGSLRVQGWVAVHGLQDGTQIRYCEVA